MNAVRSQIQKLGDSLWTDESTHQIAAWIVKLTYLFAILKSILSWPVSQTIVSMSEFSHSTLYFFPLRWITNHIEIFLIVYVAMMVFSLFRSNYLVKTCILLFGILYFRIHISVINGADAVLLALFCFAIFLDPPKKYKSNPWSFFFSNSALLLAKIHLTTLYFVSGVDKLLSAAWRSGEAMNYLSQIDYLFNPHLIYMYPTNPTLQVGLSWLVILFEIFFFMIWIKPFRKPILIAGVIFHLLIIVLLSLPDFGLIMIIYYLVFLKDIDLFKTSTQPIPSYTL